MKRPPQSFVVAAIQDVVFLTVENLFIVSESRDEKNFD